MGYTVPLPPRQPSLGDRLAETLALMTAAKHDQERRAYEKSKMEHDLATMKFQERQQKQKEVDDEFGRSEQDALSVISHLTGTSAMQPNMFAGIPGMDQMGPAATGDIQGQHPIVQIPLHGGGTVPFRPQSLEEQMGQRAKLQAMTDVAKLREVTAEADARAAATAKYRAPVTPPNLQHVETSKGIQLLDPKTGTLGPVIAQGKPPASTIVNSQTQDVTQNNARELFEGNLLPTMLSRRSSTYNATLAEANRISKEETGKPFNFVKQQLDYKASERFVASMNSQASNTFRSLSDSVINTADEVRDLANQLKQSSVQKWNQVTREGVRQVYGNTPESELANRYVAAVNTFKEEYAKLIQGGVPTDSTWKLVDKQLSQNFGFKDVNASVTELQRLLKYRQQAFTNLTPLLTTGSNPEQSKLDTKESSKEVTVNGVVWVTGPDGVLRRK